MQSITLKEKAAANDKRLLFANLEVP